MSLNEDREYCRKALPEVSRTFAISIGRLPEPKDLHIGVPYLLCRIPDTIEDAKHIPTEEKCRWLELYAELLAKEERRVERIDEVLRRISVYRHDTPSWNLVANSRRVFRVLETFPSRVRRAVVGNLTEMVRGMREFIERHDNRIRIGTLEEFRRYCYFVAGTVGRLLTEIFETWYEWPSGLRGQLEEKAILFGEALQSVNILKDIYTDYHDEDSVYVPRDFLAPLGLSEPETMFAVPGAASEAVKRLIVHSKNCLEAARGYIRMLPAESVEAREFCIVPYLLALRTIHVIERDVGAVLTPRGAKVSRGEVTLLLNSVPECIRSNEYLEGISSRALQERFLCA
ncbi:MAG: hypothetical protein D6679_01415 [Candidatus Hydrogenedentota bacterium]|nr:MAG: hypothetical protein D6679_01415 [Candidatus Hydrogenedentota bacterium]